MQGTAKTLLGLLVAVAMAPFAAHAYDYEVRHDRKLERMILERAASYTDTIRGRLEAEWRVPSAMERIVAMSALDLSLHALAWAKQPSTAIASNSIAMPSDQNAQPAASSEIVVFDTSLRKGMPLSETANLGG